MALALYACGGKDEAKPERLRKKRVKRKRHKKGIVLSPEAMKNAGIQVEPVTLQSPPGDASADRQYRSQPGPNVPRDAARAREGRRSLRLHRHRYGRGCSACTPRQHRAGGSESRIYESPGPRRSRKANGEREKRLFEQKISPQKDLIAAQAEERRAEAEVPHAP